MNFAVVYDGEDQASYIPQVLSMLDQVGEATPITSQDIIDGALNSFHAVVFPGSLASWFGLRQWGMQFAHAIRYFVAAGGGYLGVCGGAYIAGRAPVNLFRPLSNLSLELADIKMVIPPLIKSIGSYKQAQFHRYAVGIYFAVSHPVTEGHIGESIDVVYSSGPLMEEPGETVDVLAYFSDNDFPGKAAIVATYFGQGRVVLISPHPESTWSGDLVGEPSVPWLYPRMATWVAERELEVKYATLPWRAVRVTTGLPVVALIGGTMLGAIMAKTSRRGP